MALMPRPRTSKPNTITTQGREYDHNKVTARASYEPCDLTTQQQRDWDMTRAALLWNCPAFTHILYSMMNPNGGKSVALFTKGIETLATDGVNLIVNPDYFFGLKLSERVFAVAHEIMHCVLDHCGQMHSFMKRGFVPLMSGKRLEFFDKYMNFACDYIINDLLIESKVGSFKSGWLHDKSMATAQDSAIDVYERLFKKHPPQKGQAAAVIGNGSQAGFDQHLPPGTGDLPGQAQTGAAGSRNAQEWKTAVAAATASAKAQGKLPAAMEAFFGALLDPVVSWQDKIQAFFARKVGSGSYNWKKPDRRMISRNPDPIYAPSRSGHGCGKIVVGFDTSGSIYGDPGLIDRFMAEVGGMLADLRPQALYIVWCDAHVHRHDEVDELTDLTGLKPVGGGGTSFIPVFDWIREQGIEPDALVYLTDGYGSFPTQAPNYEVLWGNISAPGSVKYPFGTVVDIPKAA